MMPLSRFPTTSGVMAGDPTKYPHSIQPTGSMCTCILDHEIPSFVSHPIVMILLFVCVAGHSFQDPLSVPSFASSETPSTQNLNGHL